VISCLEGHPLFAVYDAYSTHADAPSAKTKAVDVWQSVKGLDLAYVGNNSLGADDLTGAGATAVNEVAGPIHYGFSRLADGQNRLDVTRCVLDEYAGTSAPRQSSTRSTGGTSTGASPSTGTSPTTEPGVLSSSTPVNSSAYRTALAGKLAQIPALPSSDIPKIVDCAVQKLKSQGIATVGQVHMHAAEANADGQACARALGLS
jgi:hypothetical protein